MSDILDAFERFYELEYKLAAMQASRFRGQRASKIVKFRYFSNLYAAERDLLAVARRIGQMLAQLFSYWLDCNDVHNFEPWFRCRIGDLFDILEGMKWDGENPGAHQSSTATREDVFLQWKEDRVNQNIIEEIMNWFAIPPNRLLFPGRTSVAHTTPLVKKFIKNLNFKKDSDVTCFSFYRYLLDNNLASIKHIVEDAALGYAYPVFRMRWGHRLAPILATNERIHNQLVNFPDNAGKASALISYATNAVHSSGSMLDHLYDDNGEDLFEFGGITEEDLRRLSNIDPEAIGWNDDLREIGFVLPGDEDWDDSFVPLTGGRRR